MKRTRGVRRVFASVLGLLLALVLAGQATAATWSPAVTVSASGIAGQHSLVTLVAESKKQVADFYRIVVQQLRPWTAAARKLPSPPDPAEPVASPRPPDFTAEGATEPGEGSDAEDASR